MRYLNNSFWRMGAGLAIVLFLGVFFLILSQVYADNNVNTVNYLAGSKGEN